MNALTYTDPGFSSLSYQDIVCKIVAKYRRYAVIGVADSFV